MYVMNLLLFIRLMLILLNIQDDLNPMSYPEEFKNNYDKYLIPLIYPNNKKQD